MARTVTESELAALAGLLDPAHRDTAQAIAQVAASIDSRPAHRFSRRIGRHGREAGILVGLRAQLQRYGKGERRKALDDALILLTAARSGCVVFTRNASEFDLLMQLDAAGQTVFCDA